MAKEDYLPRDDNGRVALLIRFRNVIGGHAANLGLSAQDLAAQAADAEWAEYVLRRMETMRGVAEQWTVYKGTLFLGKGATSVPGEPPMPQPVPPAVAPGIFTRFRALVRRIKAAPGYSAATGHALGIIGPEPAPPDVTAITPRLRLQSESGRVVVLWRKGRNEALRLEVDRGAGKWELLSVAMKPRTPDPTPFPAEPEKWRYRGMFISKGQPIGKWSSVVEMVVWA